MRVDPAWTRLTIGLLALATQVVTQIVEQVAAKMALDPRDFHVRFALATR